MKHKLYLVGAILILFFSCISPNYRKHTSEKLAQAPPKGWNSFNSYGVYFHEEAAEANLEAFASKLQPFGYEYYVIDGGWYGEFKLKEGTTYPAEKHAVKLNFNRYGLLQPSNTYFPNGLQRIIDRCHELGLKFGIHLMRGIPRAAVKANTPVQGTPYFAQDIADTTSICTWNPQNYGIDMDQPGAQEFYNSLVNQMANWGVDFLKYDDLVPYPQEVQAVVNAIAQCGRPMVLSLSPGDEVDTTALDVYKDANMLRVTADIWDDQKGIDQSFQAWHHWQGKEEPGFWIDLDMIPFGQLQLMAPKPEEVSGNETKSELTRKIESGELPNVVLLAGRGWRRWSKLTKDQKLTFITLRAMAASPLFIGGDLPTLDQHSLDLLTNSNVLECNNNGVMGKLVHKTGGIEIWNTREDDTQNGWVGIFNREDHLKTISLERAMLGLREEDDYELYNIWENKKLENLNFSINPNGVIFLRYMHGSSG